MNKHWRESPPVHVTVAAFVGYKPQRVKDDPIAKAANDAAIMESIARMPRTTWQEAALARVQEARRNG